MPGPDVPRAAFDVETTGLGREDQEMFPLGELYGTDYKDAANNLATKRSDGRVTVYHGDQADEHFLAQFTKKSGGRFDVIIDDGGHSPSQQMISFNILFEQDFKYGAVTGRQTVAHIQAYPP